MGFYAKKTMIGYKEAAEEEADFYIQEVGDYKKTIKEISDLRTELKAVYRESAAAQQRQREVYEKKISNATDQANMRIRGAQAKVDAIIEELKKTKDDVKRLEGLNANLKRIAKERANRSRGITPKKQHDGYVVLRSEEWKEKWVESAPGKSKKVIHKEADAWKSIIQTPVDASLPLDEVEDDIGHALKNVLQEMGCKCAGDRDGQYDERWAANMMYRWKHRANFKTGLWEVEIYTTKSLRVPEHRRPPQRIKKGRGKESEKGSCKKVIYADDSDLDHS